MLPEHEDAELPGPDGFFYLVGGRSAGGRGTLGFASDGVDRVAGMECP